MTTAAVTRADVAATEPVIRAYIRRTPVLEVSARDFDRALPDATLVLKLELTQQAGSFKARGAFANLLLRDVPAAGVVAASGGNHGAAVAYAAGVLGIPARIFVPTISTPAKVERIRNAGAQLELVGERYADALAAAEVYARATGAMAVHAFDQRETMMGAGTLALELAAQVGARVDGERMRAGSAAEGRRGSIDAVLAAVGGGGLIGGIAAYCAGDLRVIGVEPELAPTLYDALAAGRVVDAPAGGIAADSLAPKRIGELVFPIARRYVERSVLVTDDAIAAAQHALWTTVRVAAEPGGAAALAAVLSRRFAIAAGERIAIVVSGGNTSAVSL